jgi:hypothetical protein
LVIENQIHFGFKSSINNHQSTIGIYMSRVRLKIDVAGTVGDEAWRDIKQFDQIQSANFGPQFGSGGLSAGPVATAMPPAEAKQKPYPKGAWIGAEIKLLTPLLAQYAVSHYLEQERVLDADVVE